MKKFIFSSLLLLISNLASAQTTGWTLVDPPSLPTLESAGHPLTKEWEPSFESVLTPTSPWEKINLPTSPDKDIIRKAFEDGGAFVGGGGGEGVVCFDDEAQAQAAFDERGRLRDESRKFIDYIFVQDMIENSAPGISKALPGETPRAYIFRHLARMQKYAPYFANQLAQAVHLILAGGEDVEHWQDRGSLEKIDDAGFKLSGPKTLSRNGFYCREVQMAIRYELYDQENPGNPPRVFVDYDKDLYDRLGSFSHPKINSSPTSHIAARATLIFHEALYLMGSMIGMKDSSEIRGLLGILFMDQEIFEYLRERAKKEQGRDIPVTPPYKEYNDLLIFLTLYESQAMTGLQLSPAEAVSPEIRRLREAYASLLNKFREASTARPKESAFLDIMTFASPWHIQFYANKNLSDEESFLYLTYLDYYYGRSTYSPEIFLLESTNSQPAAQWLCAHYIQDATLAVMKAEKRLLQTPGLVKIYDQAINYCKAHNFYEGFQLKKGTLHRLPKNL